MDDEFWVGEESSRRAENFTSRFSGYLESSLEHRAEFLHSDFLAAQNRELEAMGKEVAGDAPVGDVVSDTAVLNRHLQFAQNLDLPVPVVSILEIGDIPVLNPEFTGGFPPGFRGEQRPDLREWWFSSYRRGATATPLSYRYIPPRGILEGFRRGLAKFLGFRFEGFHFWQQHRTSSPQAPSGPAPPGTALPGLNCFRIQLWSQQPKLAAYASPAYALTWRGLGSFTVPADGALPPGVWIFGASGKPAQFAFDPNPVFVPPTFTPSTTWF